MSFPQPDYKAADAAMANIRIWSTRIQPGTPKSTPQAAARLADILQNNCGIGTMGLVWGPDIDMIETDDTGHLVGCAIDYEPPYTKTLREGIAELLGAK